MRVAPAAAWRLGHLSVKGGVYAADISQDDPDGWIRMRVDLESRDIACETLLAYGPDVEVLAPAELRELVARRARRTAAVYDVYDAYDED
jgi:predicted DNA-binding transcriptional regulator YafY